MPQFLLSSFVALLLGLGALLPTASDWFEGIQRQPETILVHNKTDLQLHRVLLSWSQAVNVGFREAGDKEPDLIITQNSENELHQACQKDCIGWSSSIGDEEGATQIMLHELITEPTILPVFSHELGHFFGLKHQAGCSLMRADGITNYYCPNGSWDKTTCNLSPEDRIRLRTMYGLSETPKSPRCFTKKEWQERYAYLY